MSYTYTDPCYNCKDRKKCSDSNIIKGAIQAIHSNTRDKGHLGAGNITLDCIRKNIDETYDPNDYRTW